MTGAVDEAFRPAASGPGGWCERGISLTVGQVVFYERLLRAFPQRGGAPDAGWVRAEAKRVHLGLAATLAGSAARGLIGWGPQTGALTAYPFSVALTPHRVELQGGRPV